MRLALPRGVTADSRTRFSRVCSGLIAAILGSWTGANGQPSAALVRCEPSGALESVRDLPEASGLAVSQRSAGRLWSHNDSGEPVLLALDTRGAVVSRVRVSGMKVEDWEAVGVGPCPQGSCVYIADIGDNNTSRKHITVARVPEPAEERAVTVTDVFHATYPDGPHDAETLLVSRDGVFIVTKSEDGPISLYRFPRDLTAGAMHRLERIATTRASKEAAPTDPITDGAISPDGAWVVLRSSTGLSLYRSDEFLKGEWREAGRVDLKALKEPQGEGVAIAADGTVYLVGEGGGASRPGTFGKLACSMNAER